MNLKKLILPLFSSAILASSVMAADLKVGDKMSTGFKDAILLGQKGWSSEDGKIYGTIDHFDTNAYLQTDYLKVYRDCDGKKLYFAYFDGNKLYLDNNPNDSRIDEIHDSVQGRDASIDAPKCILGV